jgi:hypothetical protein
LSFFHSFSTFDVLFLLAKVVCWWIGCPVERKK